MAQRMFSDKEAIALNLIYLAKAYQHKYKDNTNDFLLQCAALAFKHDSLSMNALLLKAEITENRLLAAMQANNISTLSKARTNNQTKLLLASYEKQLSDLYMFGYREIPKEIERVILAKIQNREEGSILKDYTPNPFADIKIKTRYKTLSNGLFDEIHEAVDSIQYNHALLDTKTKKIIKLLPIEANDEYKVDPIVFALSVDPLGDKYPSISPYAYCAWNPVILVDPDGNRPVFYKVLELRGQTKAGVSRAGSSWNYGGYTISPIYDVGNKNLIGYNAGRTGADGSFRAEYQMDAGDVGEFTKNIDLYTAAANLAYISGEPNMNYMMLGQNIAEGNVSGAIGNFTDAWESAGKDPGFWLTMATSIAGTASNIASKSNNVIESIQQSSGKTHVTFGKGKASEFYKTLNTKWDGSLYKVDDYFSRTSFKTSDGTKVSITTTSNSTGKPSVKIESKKYSIIFRFPEY